MEIQKTESPKPIVKKKKVKEAEVKKEFKKYFAKLKRKLSLEPSLEEVIWLHFKAKGFLDKELFDEGIKSFGYKL